MIKQEVEQNTGTLKFFLSCHAILGIATVALGAYSATFDSALIEFSNIFLENLEVSLYGLRNLAQYGSVISGVLVFLFALVAIRFTKLGRAAMSPKIQRTPTQGSLEEEERKSVCCGTKEKRNFRVAVTFLSVLFFSQIIAAGTILLILQSMHRSIETIAVSSKPLGELESEISTLQLAIFNVCCFEEDWSIQGKVEKCPDQSGVPPPCSLPEKYQKYSNHLCTCYSHENYDEFYNSVSKDKRVCEVLSSMVVGISSSDRIPGTDLPISAFVPVNRARIVGFNGPTAEDSVTKDEPKGYGCGFGGFAKAFQWSQFKYLSDKSSLMAIIMICISIVEIIVLVFIVCLLRSQNDDEYFEDILDDFVAEHKQSKAKKASSFILDSPRKFFGMKEKSKKPASSSSEIQVSKLQLDP